MKTSHKSRGYTLMVNDLLKLRVIKAGKSKSEYWLSGDYSDFNTVLSHSNWSINVHNFSTSSLINHDMTKDFVNDLINDSIKPNSSNKTINVRNNGNHVIILILGINLRGLKINTSDSFFKITNVTRFFFHFHALLVRRRGEVGPQDHLEVGVEIGWQMHTLNCLEERRQIEESSVGSLASSDATVVNNSDAFVTVVTGIVIMSGCADVPIRHCLAVMSAVVVVVGAGTRAARAGTAGCRTTHRSLINTNKMRFDSMSRDQRDVRHHAMISKHQLARSTTWSEETMKYYNDENTDYIDDKLNFFNFFNYIDYGLNYGEVMICHQIWQDINKKNKTIHFNTTITIDGGKSHNVVTIKHKFLILSTMHFNIFQFNLNSIIVHLNGTRGYQLDMNVTDKGCLQNAMPEKTTIECFMSILSIFIKGSLRTRILLLLILQYLEQITRNSKQKNSDNTWQILQTCTSILSCHSTYYANRLIHDIELNPGPTSVMNTKVSLTVVTLNCRGLGSTDKFRLILNKAYEFMNKGETIIMLQETMVVHDNYLKLAWRGNSVFTPGIGNSLGCITLTNATSNISLINQIGNRGHYFTYSSPLITTAIIMNLYAPQGFDEAKTNFFIDNFNIISNYDCDIIVGGDMNVTLRPNDRHCRGVTNAELILAEEILAYQQALGLEDTWQGKSGYTWQKGQKMSKLDRIFYRITNFKLKSNKVDWTLAKTDHAAVVARFEHAHNVIHKSTHVKLDNDILKDIGKLNELKEYVTHQLNDPQVATFNPHVKLEFAKMSIRTKALDIMARCRKQKNELLNEINKEILTNTRLLGIENDIQLKNMLVRELETLKVQKDTILSEQGEKLANLARTKWYNEGEKSNKYFLNMLKRQQSRSDMNCLIINGVECTNGDIIKEHVKDFYQHLYNHGRYTQIEPSFFDNMFTIEADLNDSIKADITLNELWQTLKSLRATTPGPDGISNTYLKKLFDIMGPLIIDAWR